MILSAATLRNDLLKHLTSSESLFDWQTLLLLLNTETKSLDLDKCEIISTFIHFCDGLTHKVAAAAPNLEFFSLSDEIEPRYENLLQRYNKSFFLNSIVMLKNLKHLSLYGYLGLDNEDLQLVTKNLKNLVSLKVIFCFMYC